MHRLLISRIEINDTVTDEILWRMQNTSIAPRTKSHKDILDRLPIHVHNSQSEHYTTDIHTHIYINLPIRIM